MTVAVFRVVPDFVLPRTEEALRDVVKLEPESFLVHYSLPLSAPYTLLSDKTLTRDSTDDEVIAHCGLYVLLPSFEGELRMKGGGGLRKWNTRFFVLRHEQLLIFKHRGDKKPQSSTSVRRRALGAPREPQRLLRPPPTRLRCAARQCTRLARDRSGDDDRGRSHAGAALQVDRHGGVLPQSVSLRRRQAGECRATAAAR
jgi:hypothetical protein